MNSIGCFVVLFALTMGLVVVNAERQFSITDKVGQGNFAYDGAPIDEFYPMGKRASFAFGPSRAVSGKFARFAEQPSDVAAAAPSAERRFAFAFAKRAAFA